MNFTDLRPILWTEKLDDSIRFYTETLGFNCGEKNDEWGWASLQCGQVGIMLAKPNKQLPFDKPVFTGSFYINVDDVNLLWENLKDKTEVVYAIDNFPWEMREFAIYDNNGYILQFGQPII